MIPFNPFAVATIHYKEGRQLPDKIEMKIN